MQRTIPEGIRIVNRRARRSIRVSAPRAARSLDSGTYLQTTAKNELTFAEWQKQQETAHDKRRKQSSLHRRYMDSLAQLGFRYEHVKREADIDAATGKDRGYLYALARLNSQKFKPWKTLKRVSECQTNFLGFKPTCCDSRALAVPIVCNDRLCPLCNAHRAEHFRGRVQQIFAMVDNAQLLTLTVPNCPVVTSDTIRTLRKRFKGFLAQQKGFLLGGVYSIECTYNRAEKTWHPHIHALVDVNDDRKKLPYWEFCERKWKLEFDWLVLTQGRAKPGKRHWHKSDYDEWVAGVDPRRRANGYTREGHRRTIDLRPCTSDRKAAYEVLKYITKSVGFVDNPDALSEFMNAVHGVRVIQTFGSCYGVKFDEPDLQSHMECECGANEFEPIGLLGLGMTKMSPEGKWYVRDDAPIHGRQRCRGQTQRKETHHHGIYSASAF